MAIIKTAIELEDRVSKPLADVAKSLEITARSINNIGTTGPDAGGLNQYFISLKNGTEAVTQHGNSVKELTTGYRVLNLILREAGISLGGFRALSMAASTGMVGLSVAVGGALLLALEKLQESLRNVKTGFENAMGVDAGQKIFDGLKKEVDKSNSSVGGLADGAKRLYEAFSTLPRITGWMREFKDTATYTPEGARIEGPPDTVGQLVPSGFSTQKKDLSEMPQLLRLISQAFQIEGATAATADKTTNDLMDSLLKIREIDLSKLPGWSGTGQRFAFDFQGITQDMYTTLQRNAPKLMGVLDDTLRGGFTSVRERIAEEGSISIDDFSKAILAKAPEIAAAFEKMKPSVAQAGSNVWNEFLKWMQGEGKVDIISGNLDAIARKLKELRQESEKSGAADGVKSTTEAVGEFIPKAREGAPLTSALERAFYELYNTITNQAGPATTALRQFNDELARQRTLGLSGGTPQAGGGSLFEPPGGFASGGLFRGRGGVDTNLAWLTHGEYIVPRHAVEKYGLQFFEWIRTLQFPIRGFAEGGLNVDRAVSISSPSISSMQSSRSLTLVLDTKRFNISGSKSTIDALEREATMRGISATGLAPGWVR